MCEVLEISEKNYYKNLKNSSRDDHDASLIYEVFNESMHPYGYIRIKQAIFYWIWFYIHGRIKDKRKTIEYINYKEKYGKNK